MTDAVLEIGHGTLRRLGRLSTRETVFLVLVLVLLLGYALGDRWILQSVNRLQDERVRLAASEASLANVTALLDHQDEILAKATRLIGDYRRSEGTEPSSLLLERIDRLKDAAVELESIHPLLASAGTRARFRVELAGPPDALGRLFFTLGETAPPILLKDCLLSASSVKKNEVRAIALLEIHEEESLESTIALLESHLRQGENRLARRDSTAKPMPVRRPPTSIATFPFRSLGRRDIFRESGAEARGGTRALSLGELTKKLVFSGVIWGDDPVAIVEDSETARIYYCRMGEYIGELEVRQVGRTFIVLGHKEEEIRLQ